MKTNPRIYLFTTVFILSLTGCFKHRAIEGNHHVERDNRNVKEFTAIENHGDFEVIVLFDSTTLVSVEAEENLLPYVETFISGKTLVIEERQHYNIYNHYPIRVYVSAFYINAIALKGSGDMDVSGMDAAQFNVDLKGSGNIKLDVLADVLDINIDGSGNAEIEGKTKDLDVSINGSGDVDAYSLEAQNCFVRINGSGDTYTKTTDLLDVNVKGSGNTYYVGNPKINLQIDGSGKVINKNE